MILLKAIKRVFFPVWIPFYSFFSKNVGFTLIVPTPSGWFAYTRKKFFPIKSMSLDSLEYFRHFVPAIGSVVFDVGGEFGFETDQFSKMVGKSGKIYVFECFPAHIEHLKNLFRTRENVVVVEKACWNSKAEIVFYQGNTPGSNTALPEARGQIGQRLANENVCNFVVQADTLDSIWSDLASSTEIDFLKMDIEGAEIEALEGAKKMLKHTNKVVVAAYHMREGKPTAERVLHLLNSAGFKTCVDENLHVYGIRQ